MIRVLYTRYTAVFLFMLVQHWEGVLFAYYAIGLSLDIDRGLVRCVDVLTG